MGKLVGGQKVVEQTGGGRVHYSGSSNWIVYSCDTITFANEADQRHNISTSEHWGSETDPVSFEEYVSSSQLK